MADNNPTVGTDTVITEEFADEMALADELFGDLLDSQDSNMEQSNGDETDTVVSDGEDNTGHETEENEDTDNLESDESDNPDGEDEGEYSFADLENHVKVKINGEEAVVSVDEAAKGYQRQQDYTRKSQELASRQTELDNREFELLQSLELAKLETDYLLEEAGKVQWDNLSPEEFKATTLQQRRLREKAGEIQNRLNTYRESQTTKQEQTSQHQIAECVATLQREVAGFDNDLYGQAIAFATTELGVNPDVMANCTDAGMLRAIIHAMQTMDSKVKPRKTSPRMPRKTADKPQQHRPEVHYDADDARAWEAFV